MQKDFPGIRLLCLTVDNTFMSEVALSNIKQVIEKLGVEHITYRPPKEFMEKMYRYAFLNLNAKGCSGTVDQFDGDFICDVGRRLASKLNIPMLFIGLSKVQCERILDVFSYESPRQRELRNRTHSGTSKLSDAFTSKEISKYFWQGGSTTESNVARVFFPFYVWEKGEEEIKNELRAQNLLPKKNQSPLVTNNKLIPLMGLVDMAKFGFSSFEAEFAETVRSGTSDRLNWLYTFELLEYASKTGKFISKGVDEVLLRLNLTRSELGIKK